jgi:hypothetical protein
MAEFLP